MIKPPAGVNLAQLTSGYSSQPLGGAVPRILKRPYDGSPNITPAKKARCQLFDMGGCTKGALCQFSHVDNAAASGYDPAAAIFNQHSMESTGDNAMDELQNRLKLQMEELDRFTVNDSASESRAATQEEFKPQFGAEHEATQQRLLQLQQQAMQMVPSFLEPEPQPQQEAAPIPQETATDPNSPAGVVETAIRQHAADQYQRHMMQQQEQQQILQIRQQQQHQQLIQLQEQNRQQALVQQIEHANNLRMAGFGQQANLMQQQPQMMQQQQQQMQIRPPAMMQQQTPSMQSSSMIQPPMGMQGGSGMQGGMPSPMQGGPGMQGGQGMHGGMPPFGRPFGDASFDAREKRESQEKQERLGQQELASDLNTSASATYALMQEQSGPSEASGSFQGMDAREWVRKARERKMQEEQWKKDQEQAGVRARTPGYKSTICKYYDMGSCQREHLCTYAHGLEELNANRVSEAMNGNRSLIQRTATNIQERQRARNTGGMPPGRIP